MQASRPVTVTALGIAQILGWGTSFYFPAVLAPPIVADTGWPLSWVVSGTSVGLLMAGLIAPKVGSIIDRHGGRPVLAVSSLLYAAGLSCIGLAPSLPFYLLGWILLGGGMGTGLYDAVFAALGKLYGKDARAPITNLTLFGGFASTVCWPLSAFLAETFGWRSACLAYAALHLIICLPLQMSVMPPLAQSPFSEPGPVEAVGAVAAERSAGTSPGNDWPILLLLASILTISAAIGSIMIVHMMVFLQERGASFAFAITLGTLFGPAQVGARVIERLFGANYHPIWTMMASCTAMLVGLTMLVGGLPLLWLTILVYGGGYGIMWIARAHCRSHCLAQNGTRR
ncbi:MFS transporter [Rhodoplanes sp. Z2-YC6860]|uniref:MFS transporter n=1 Tax=Rhodoplanes sp. Z2-YC6860 TaxID=674703 RepID=UPI0026CC27C9